MLSARGLHKSFNGQPVLKGMDLEVQSGEVIALIGPSGSGKTTLLRCLNLLETPDSGKIRVGNLEIDAGLSLHSQQAKIRQLRQQVGFALSWSKAKPAAYLTNHAKNAPANF
ncbi:hypothetical protein HA402_010128 [Bradysia odoriphaga]|nr:hypothetical protein HA402_010128 [Bradysia odoriphaga]